MSERVGGFQLFDTGLSSLDLKLLAQVLTGEEQPFTEEEMVLLSSLHSDTGLPPLEFYNQNAADAFSQSTGVPVRDASGHGLSRFKMPGHPRTFVGGHNTITGQPQQPFEQPAFFQALLGGLFG